MIGKIGWSATNFLSFRKNVPQGFAHSYNYFIHIDRVDLVNVYYNVAVLIMQNYNKSLICAYQKSNIVYHNVVLHDF